MTDHDAAFGQLGLQSAQRQVRRCLDAGQQLLPLARQYGASAAPISLAAALPIACSRRDHFTRLETLARNSAAVVRQVAPA